MAYIGGSWASGSATDPSVTTGAASTASISGIAPTTFIRKSSITLTVTGTGFTPTTKIYANYEAVATTYDSATQLRCIGFNTTPDSGAAGTIPIGVVKTGEKISNIVNFNAT
jgi:hypothetical protein